MLQKIDPPRQPVLTGQASRGPRRHGTLRTMALLFAPVLGALVLALVFGNLLAPEGDSHPPQAGVALPAPGAPPATSTH